jgi:hypothetical protein
VEPIGNRSAQARIRKLIQIEFATAGEPAALRFYSVALICVSGICVSGEPGCRPEELARIAAHRLGCALVTESSLSETIAGEFGAATTIADRAWPHVVTSIIAKLGLEQHILMFAAGSELLFQQFPAVFRGQDTR